MPDYSFIFDLDTSDVDETMRVEGTLPEGLSGTFFAIGSAGAKAGETPIHHLDGHGKVTAAKLGKGTPTLKARMVKTPLYAAETSAGKMVTRRVFTNKPSRWSNALDLNLGNNAWHNVVRFGKHVAATNDPGFFLLDAESLETVGPAPLRAVKGGSLTPMPRRDPSTGHTIVFEIRPGLKDKVVIREVDDQLAVSKETHYALPSGANVFHDVIFTARYYVICPFGELSVPKALWGARPVYEAIAAAKPCVYLLPRQGGAAIRVDLPATGNHFHFWNAFDREDGKVVFDAVQYTERVAFEGLLPAALRPEKPLLTPKPCNARYLIDPSARTAERSLLTDLPSESPAIRDDFRGRAYRYGWSPAPSSRGDEEDKEAYVWWHGLARHDFEKRTVSVWDAGPRVHVSAVAVVPRPGSTVEDDGWVLAWLQDAATKTASVGVFDAAKVEAGPIAKVHASRRVGGVSHVSFS